MKFPVILLAISQLLFATETAAKDADAPSTRMEQLVISDPGQAPLAVAVWSPADGARRALIVISHGTGGAPFSHADTAQALAQAGFIVAAVMHRGDNFQDDSRVGKPDWIGSRAAEVSRTITFMTSEWRGGGGLPPGKVGVFGFSAGGTTGLVSIGGRPDLGRIAGHCARTPEFVCALFAQEDGRGTVPPDWRQDDRIGAAVIAAPGLGFAFDPDGLAGVHVPVQLWAGEADATVPEATNVDVIRRLLGPSAELHLVPGARHLSFLAPCTEQSPPQLCDDGPDFDRGRFHTDFNRQVVDFFNRALLGPAQGGPGPRPASSPGRRRRAARSR